MAGFGDGFASGLNSGMGLVTRFAGIRRQKELDERDRQRFEREQAGWKREDDARAREDSAWSDYENLSAGVGPQTQTAIQNTYGMTPQQTAAAPRVWLLAVRPVLNMPKNSKPPGNVSPRRSGRIRKASDRSSPPSIHAGRNADG